MADIVFAQFLRSCRTFSLRIAFVAEKWTIKSRVYCMSIQTNMPNNTKRYYRLLTDLARNMTHSFFVVAFVVIYCSFKGTTVLFMLFNRLLLLFCYIFFIFCYRVYTAQCTILYSCTGFSFVITKQTRNNKN